MITLFILTLVAVGLAFAMVPVLAFALMLETCAERTGTTARVEAVYEEAPLSSGLRLVSVS